MDGGTPKKILREFLKRKKKWGGGPPPIRGRTKVILKRYVKKSGNFEIWDLRNFQIATFFEKFQESNQLFSFLRGEVHRDGKFLVHLFSARFWDQLFTFLRGEVTFRGLNRGPGKSESLMMGKAKSPKSADSGNVKF